MALAGWWHTVPQVLAMLPLSKDTQTARRAALVTMDRRLTSP